MKLKAHDLSYVLFFGKSISSKVYSDLAQKVLLKDTYTFASFVFCDIHVYRQKYQKDTESNVVYADREKLLNAIEKIVQYGDTEIIQSYLDFLSNFPDPLIAERLRGIYMFIRNNEHRNLIFQKLCSLKGLNSCDETKLIKFCNGIIGLSNKLYQKRFPLIDFKNWKTSEVFSYLTSNNPMEDQIAVNILTQTQQQMSCFDNVVCFLSNRKNKKGKIRNEELVKCLLKIDKSIPDDIKIISKFCQEIPGLDNEIKYEAIHKAMTSLLEFPNYAHFEIFADHLQKYAKLSEKYTQALALMEQHHAVISHDKYSVTRKMTSAYLDFLTREINKEEPDKQSFELFDRFIAHLYKYGSDMTPKEQEAISQFLIRHRKKIIFADKMSDLTKAMLSSDAALDPLILEKWFCNFPEHIEHIRYHINYLAAFRSVLKIYNGTRFPIKNLVKNEICKIIAHSNASLGECYAEGLAEVDLLNIIGLPDWMSPFMQAQKDLLKKQKLVLKNFSA